MSFTEKLDQQALDFFNSVCELPFSRQAMSFLNAYWAEVGDQAEFMFSVAWDKIKYADMHFKGITVMFNYDESNDLDFDASLYFYEQLCKYCDPDGANQEWVNAPYTKSQPEMMTSIVRKKELRDKVDVNFDNRVSFLEYLLYQYREFANPADFCVRSMAQGDEHPEVRAARLALEEVNKRIREYEQEKARLEAEAEKEGVRGLKAVNMLAQLGSSPLAEALNMALIKAEAALRKANKLYGGAGGGGGGASGGGEIVSDSVGSMWWMNRELQEKKRHYGNSAVGKKATRSAGLNADIGKGAALKKTTTTDKSGPNTAGAKVGKNNRGAVFGDIQKGKGLKTAETNDRSAPKTAGASVKKGGGKSNMLAELLAKDEANREQ